MCGIFVYLSVNSIGKKNELNILNMANKISHRGPDQTNYKLLFNSQVMMVFHRLKIVDLSDSAIQPFEYKDNYSICNGELYNYIMLKKKYNLTLNSNCDCEILNPLIKTIGIDSCCKQIDGVFSFVTLNNKTGDIWVGRDPFGVRSLYIGNDDIGNMIISSEMKSFPREFIVRPFPPGNYSKIVFSDNKWSIEFTKAYFSYEFKQNFIKEEKILTTTIKQLLDNAVTKRLMSDRPIGCLLSGGLDSSIITAILVQKK